MHRIILLIFCIILFFTSNYTYAHITIRDNKYTKMRDNKVYFTGDTTSVSFQITNGFITKGQPFESTVHSISHHGLKIRAGRKGSHQVVIDVLGANISGGLFNYNSTFEYTPHKLNFAVQGTLIINGKQFNDIILAQGHTCLSNNWWFTGKNCVSYEPHTVDATDCTATDGTHWCFTRGYTSNYAMTSPNHVKLSKHTCHKQYS